MAPTKRARPAFSPPRPGKSKTAANTATKHAKQPSKRSRYTSVTESESDSQGADDTAEEEEEEAEEEDADEDDEDTMRDEDPGRARPLSSSPEPDYMLAEITHDKNDGSHTGTSSSTTPSIPLPLIHRILHAHFAKPDRTKLSKDAREVLAKYFDVFVREAIMRCAYEKSRPALMRREDDDLGDAGVDGVVSDGWLEVDDLEKVAVQLCLDF